MSRSVAVPNNVCVVAYAYFEENEDEGDDAANYLWQFAKEEFITELLGKYSSLHEVSDWIEQDCHVLLENKYAQIGISEYCGVVACWAKPKDYLETPVDGLAVAFCSKVRLASPARNFGTLISLVGRCSNGYCVY